MKMIDVAGPVTAATVNLDIVRHGDVILRRVPVAAPPMPTKPRNRRITLVSGVNGHAHVVTGNGASITKRPETVADVGEPAILSLPAGGTLDHPEHGPVLLEPGDWTVAIQRQLLAVTRIVIVRRRD